MAASAAQASLRFLLWTRTALIVRVKDGNVAAQNLLRETAPVEDGPK